MQKKPTLEYGKYFHIYNRGINSGNLFQSSENYLHFLKLYDIYIEIVAETFAWCLMPNHFHLLVRVKDEDEIGYFIPENRNAKDHVDKWKTFFPNEEYPREKIGFLKKPTPERQFSHLFNAYTKYYNKRYDRTGKLFEERFERKPVAHEKHIKNMICYIHENPVHHGFTDNIVEYAWTSYLTLISVNATRLNRDKVIGYFDNVGNFKEVHLQKKDFHDIKDIIIE